MVVNGRPLKRMKKRITADLKDFLTFPDSEEFAGNLDGPFRSNIRSFLTKHAQLSPPASLFPHLLIWQIVFRVGDLIDGTDSSPAVVTLDIVEEDVTRSRSVYCDQCRVVGWSGHPVCGKRYHFIIRAGSGSSSIDSYNKACTNCGDLLHMPDTRCKSCNYVMTANDLEEWVYLQLEDTTHLLHGVVHSNGYGHLLRVNGREGGSKFLSGCDIMNFWDRLCRTIRIRKISVMDVSKKYGLEYRLLHAITNGHPWYGDWGYEFGAGSFALTLDAYKNAVNNLSEIPLYLFFTDLREPRTRLHNVISFYKSLSESELLTMRDLFCFLMRLIRNTNDPSSGVNTCKKLETGSWALCSWTKDDIEHVEQAMIKVLRAVGEGRWVSWRSLKGALYRMASPELLDYCLKDLGGKLVADGTVYSRCNPDTDALEYRLKFDNGAVDGCSVTNCPTKGHLLRDLKFLYVSLLDHQTMIPYRPIRTYENAKISAAKLRDCKQFVKDYKPEKITLANPFAVRVLCQVELIDHPQDYTAPPPELIVLPPNATVSDIKIEATKAFQEVYVLFRRFQAEEVLGLHCDTLVGSSSVIRVQGMCLGKQVPHRFRMERGTESWTVKCICGATDDDGERMLACDGCGVWQHTRCAGIEDTDAVPERFMCGRCGRSSRRREDEKGDKSTGLRKTGSRCNENVTAEDSCRIGNNLTAAFGVR